MIKGIKVLVPEILRERGIALSELRWGAKLSLNTAKRWFDPVASRSITRFDEFTVTNIANFLQVDDISQLIQFE